MALVPMIWVAQQQPSPQVSPELLLLSKASLSMAQSLRRMPNYTCLETIERSQRLAKRRKFELIDVLRLEVGLVDRKELFAWPGSGKFEDKELADMVPSGGAIGNGSFAAHAASIFTSRTASIHFASREGNKYRYDYRVPQNLSGYKMRSGKSIEAIIGYHGSFFVDAETERVTRIEVVGDDIPVSLEVKETDASIDYGMLRIGDQDYWLPVASTMKITSLDTSEFRNEITFTGCRQFAGESKLSFDDAPVDTAPAAAPKDEVVLVPKDKLVLLDLVTPIRWGMSRTGDPVEAVLTSSIKHKRAVLFPKGTKVTGRIVRMQDAGSGQILEVEFDQITDGTRHAPFKAAYFDKGGPELMPVRPATPTRSIRRVQGVKDRPGVLVVMTYNSKLDLAKGFRSSWSTLE